MTEVTFSTEATFMKVEESLGLIIGFAVICEVDGQPYYDLGSVDSEGVRTRDHIPPSAMLKAATEFMANSRVASEMHERDENNKPVRAGEVIHTFPLTAEIAASLDITTKRTGLLVAIKPSDPAVLDKARKGEYRGFSIGGECIEGVEA
jgi:hypothetical protein